jgi:serine protease inhibitor
LEQKISTKWLHELTSGITTEEVIVQIPRFTFNSTLNLVDALTKLGMHRAFDPKSAEFERLTSESTSPPYDKRPL